MNKSELELIVLSATSLAGRLPELEWKLNTLGTIWNVKILPPGLFRSVIQMTPQVCINEIKENLTRLAQHTNPMSARLLANKISQQIHVLVRICTLHYKRPVKQQNQTRISVGSISTRQQWLERLRDEITQLTAQQEAMLFTLKQQQLNTDKKANNMMMQLQNELGEIQRRLTLSQEHLTRSTQW